MKYWIQTYTGKAFDLLNPTPDMICIEDIAHALSNICRFTGHCKAFYSVAEHSVHVARMTMQKYQQPLFAFEALLHDAHEAYMGDTNGVLKSMPDFIEPFKRMEEQIDDAIRGCFGLSSNFNERAEIKLMDKWALAIEARDCMGPEPRIWEYLEGVEPDPWLVFRPSFYLPSEAEQYFLGAFEAMFLPAD